MFDAEHPRPQLVRPTWTSLDGPWDYLADRNQQWHDPADVDWARARTIAVPYSPETLASRINDTTACRDHWYRREVTAPDGFDAALGHRLLLHFGAVDHVAEVFVAGRQVGAHEGGYLPFTVDVTRAATSGEAFEVIVHAVDDPFALDQPRGKQHLNPVHPWGIFYHRTSGIWQTVWLEVVPPTAISDVVWTSCLDPLEVHFEIVVDRAVDHATLEIELSLDGSLLASVETEFVGLVASGKVSLADAGRPTDELVWSTENPILIDADIELRSAGQPVDRVSSYLGVRSFEAREGRFFLNGDETYLRFALDQGYWTHTGLTPPSTTALKRDVELAKAMGFNGVRKHQKLEDPRYLAWADRLGLLVWADLPGCLAFSSTAMLRTTNLLAGAIVRDRSHPCIVTWSPVNHSWGVPDLEGDARQRAFVRTLCDLARALDGTRPVPANDGYQAIGGNIHGVHDYEPDPAALAKRWAGPSVPPVTAGDRRTAINAPVKGSPVVLSGFGGVAIAAQGIWGYRFVDDPAAFDDALDTLFRAVRSSPVLAGFCYTQLTDTYHEATGLATMDRTPKIPVERIRQIVEGPTREEVPEEPAPSEPPRLRLVRPT